MNYENMKNEDISRSVDVYDCDPSYMNQFMEDE